MPNCLSQPYSANHDYGVAAFSWLFWLKEAPNSVTECVMERDSATTAQRITIEINAAGNLLFTCDDNTTTRTATSSATVDDGLWHLYLCQYDAAGGVKVYRDGAATPFASATGAALLTLNNAAAVLNAGLSAAGTNPLTNGTLTLVRPTAMAVSLDQFATIYETERKLFEANAQCGLAGTSNAVTALAYDDATDLLHVGTSWGRSAFQGLLRVSSEATPVGAVKALAASGGAVVQAGASAVDVYLPAYSLREELARKEEAAKALGSTPVFHEFDAIAAQTAFVVPTGFKVVAVYSAGALKRVGATKDYTIADNGYQQTVNFAVGRSEGTWVSIMTVRSN